MLIFPVNRMLELALEPSGSVPVLGARTMATLEDDFLNMFPKKSIDQLKNRFVIEFLLWLLL